MVERGHENVEAVNSRHAWPVGRGGRNLLSVLKDGVVGEEDDLKSPCERGNGGEAVLEAVSE